MSTSSPRWFRSHLHALHAYTGALTARHVRALPMMALGLAMIAGPPRITVRPMPATSDSAFELELGHHHDPQHLTVTGRAEGVRGGQRVTVPLTLGRKDESHFTVKRQWEKNAAWVLVFSVEQGPRGAHGAAEAIVSVEANGTVRDIEYMKPAIRKDGQPFATTTARIDQALKSLGLVTAAR